MNTKADELERGALSAADQAILLRMLAQSRADAGLNQTTLAERLGITQSEVSKFERGERVLDALRLRAWLRALDIEFASFADALDRALDRVEDFAGRAR